jgi:pimeloyl-ACP methyl ester carboxylesterase
VAIYALAVVGLVVFQRRFLYFPDRRLTHPAEAGMSGVEELRLMTDDGEMLVAWHLPPRDGHPLILYFHGNGGALIDRVPRFRMFAGSGYGFLAVSYRGYGGSTGSPSEAGLMRDGEAAYREARARGCEGDRIVLMGESLGTGVAIPLAATREAAALVLDSPFSSAVDVAAVHYRLLPVRWLMFDQFRSDLTIRDVHIPVLIVHGDDERVQPEQWIRACIAEPRLLGIRLLADATSPFNQWCGVFTRSQAFSPARAALRSQSNAATLSSCAAGDGAMGWRLYAFTRTAVA